MIEYKFFEIMGPTLSPVTPIPVVRQAVLDGAVEANAVIEFSGIDFGPHLSVYFGLCLAQILSV